MASDGAALTVYDDAGAPIGAIDAGAAVPFGSPLWREEGIYVARGGVGAGLVLLPSKLG